MVEDDGAHPSHPLPQGCLCVLSLSSYLNVDIIYTKTSLDRDSGVQLFSYLHFLLCPHTLAAILMAFQWKQMFSFPVRLVLPRSGSLVHYIIYPGRLS
jgi:TRAP-type mannitol/chloroaromatic compound transport system permease small subunit